MARIRTIKPEFWTDEKIVQLPFQARLMFIGMWNFADDEGCLGDEPERIRLQVLPADTLDSAAVVDLLVAADLVERVISDEQTFLHIKGFADHQKISHKAPTKFPVKSGKKQIIPAQIRREVARKYGCAPGGEKDVECYFCGAPGSIWWPKLPSGKASGWVAYGDVEFDHLEPEASGGQTTTENIVLSCRHCNRSRGKNPMFSFAFRKAPESSGTIRLEGNGKEGKGEERNRSSFSSLRSEDRAPQSDADDEDDEVHEFCVAWNQIANQFGLLAIFEAEGERQTKIRSRLNALREVYGFEELERGCQEFFAKIRASPWLRGEAGTGWRPTIDWIVEPENFAKVMEGTYEGKGNGVRRH